MALASWAGSWSGRRTAAQACGGGLHHRSPVVGSTWITPVATTARSIAKSLCSTSVTVVCAPTPDGPRGAPGPHHRPHAQRRVGIQSGLRRVTRPPSTSAAGAGRSSDPAESQHGVISAAASSGPAGSVKQLRRALWSKRRDPPPQLAPPPHGVYAFGHSTLTPPARAGWMVYVLACGPGTVLAVPCSAWRCTARSRRRATTDVITHGRPADGTPSSASSPIAVASPGLRAHPPSSRDPSDDAVADVPGRPCLPAHPRPAPNAPSTRRCSSTSTTTARCRRPAPPPGTPGQRGICALRAAVASLGDEALPVPLAARGQGPPTVLVVAGLEVPEPNAWLPTRAGHGHELDLFGALWLHGSRRDRRAAP